jgi:uncharacterized protein YndB with AHSA1/START domain
MWTVEHSAETDVAPERIWRAWTEVERWPEWNGDIAEIGFDGRFEAGSAITMTPKDQEPVTLRIAEARPKELFVDEADLAGTIIRTVHRIDRVGDGRSRVVYALEADGPLAEELGPAISADFPETIAGLLRHAAADHGA